MLRKAAELRARPHVKCEIRFDMSRWLMRDGTRPSADMTRRSEDESHAEPHLG